MIQGLVLRMAGAARPKNMSMKIKQIDNTIWEIEKHEHMQVPALIFGTKHIMEQMGKDRTLEQLKNVASLNGIIKHGVVMPDGHEGYGFPIGGIAAFDAEQGCISPGGIGYDINCGVRLVKTGLNVEEIKPKIKELTDKLFTNIPSGVGSKGKLRLSSNELDLVVSEGVDWAIEKGYGHKKDREHTEEYGKMNGADPLKVSFIAKTRGKAQLGTLGAGNHFLEIQKIESILDEQTAKAFGLIQDEVVVMIHCGSRGYGHQICTDNLGVMLNLANKKRMWLPEKELVCAPIQTQEAQNYFSAMKCAVNFAFVNRQIIMHWVRETFDAVIGNGTGENMHLVYDVAHNIAKNEEHVVDGKKTKLIVHRKGATRAFPAGRAELPLVYRDVGQPVILPGSMGTESYVLVGKTKGADLCWSSCCHGAGRVMSRGQAIRTYKPALVLNDLWTKQGIYIRATSKEVVAEEAPGAYKNVNEVVKSVVDAGICGAVAKIRPLSVVKG